MNKDKKRRKEPIIWKPRDVIRDPRTGRLYPVKLPKIIVKRPKKPQLITPGLLLKHWLLGNRFKLTEVEQAELKRLIEE